jgi:hypothetical protein
VTGTETYSSVQHDFNIIWCSCCLAVAVTSGAGTANPSEAPEFTSGFSGVHVDRSVIFLCSLL